MKKTELTKRQLKYFNQENEEIQEDILKALSREPITTTIKCGYELCINYVYEDGLLGYNMTLRNQDQKGLFSDKIFYEGDLELDGSERKSEIISVCKDFLIDELEQTPELMKKLFI